MRRSLCLFTLAVFSGLPLAAAAAEKRSVLVAKVAPAPASVSSERAAEVDLDARRKSVVREVDAWERSVDLTRHEYRAWLQERASAKKINARSVRGPRLLEASASNRGTVSPVSASGRAASPSPLNLNDSVESLNAARLRETEEAERTAFELKRRVAEESAASDDAEQLQLADEARRRSAGEQRRRDAEAARKLGGRIDESGQFVDPDLQK